LKVTALRNVHPNESGIIYPAITLARSEYPNFLLAKPIWWGDRIVKSILTVTLAVPLAGTVSRRGEISPQSQLVSKSNILIGLSVLLEMGIVSTASLVSQTSPRSRLSSAT